MTIDEFLTRCDRCGQRFHGTQRFMVSIIYAEPSDPMDGQHLDDQELTLCYGCVELCRIEIANAVWRIKERGHA